MAYVLIPERYSAMLSNDKSTKFFVFICLFISYKMKWFKMNYTVLKPGFDVAATLKPNFDLKVWFYQLLFVFCLHFTCFYKGQKY